jgi:hypothetical protein
VPAPQVIDRIQTHIRQLKRLPNKKFPVYRHFEDALMARLLAGDISAAAGRMIVERGLRQVDGGLTWSTDARLRLKSAHPFSEEQVCEFMAGILCPTLVIRALPGFPFDAQQLEGRRARIADISYHELPGNHHIHMDSARAVADLIRGFYAKT